MNETVGVRRDEPVTAELTHQLRGFIESRIRNPWDAEDVLQEVLFRIHDRQQQLLDERRFCAWAYRVARNAIIDHHRASQRNRERPAHPLPETAIQPPYLEQNRAGDPRRALAPCLAPVLRALPAHYREALTLVELEQLSQAEAARRVGVSVSGMKSRVQRARQRAHSLFEEWCSIAYDGRGAPLSCRMRRPTANVARAPLGASLGPRPGWSG